MNEGSLPFVSPSIEIPPLAHNLIHPILQQIITIFYPFLKKIQSNQIGDMSLLRELEL